MIRPTLRTLMLLFAVTFVTRAVAEEKLPTDDRIKTGKLSNGVTWLYRQHDNPPGKMALMIHIDTGSLNETDEQRGLAHFIEHMAFNGSENFAPGALVPYFESIGMEFGRDLNAFTSFDQTAYKLDLPDTKPETMDKALMVLSDYAFRQLLPDEEINKERGVVLSELRAGMSAQQRIRDQLFEKLFGDTRIGQRLPIGKENVIKDAPRSLIENYYRTWYRPDRVALIIVGDAAPEPYLPLIEKWFGQYKAPGEAQPIKHTELKPFKQARALILSDPEYSQGDVDIYNVSPGRPPTTTMEQARVDLLEEIGGWIMGRRFSDQIKKGHASYREAGAQVMNFFNDAMLVNASAVGEPRDWEKMLDELVLEINRAREYGFLKGEFELCKTELVSQAEDAVRKESTRDAQRIVREILQGVNDHEPILSAQQHLDVLKKLLPTVKLEEVSAAFKEHFKPGTFAYVLTMPKNDALTLPSEDDVMAAAKAAEARKAEAPQDVKDLADLLQKEPTPGTLVEPAKDADLAITEGWLENGVRVHHRFMDYKKDLVMLSITLAGGQIEETADNAGVTQVASLILAQPATSRLASTDIEDMLTGKNIKVSGGGTDDAFTISVSGSPKDLETGLKLAHALLTDGKLEQSAFDNWKQQALQQYAMASKMPQFAAFETFLKAVTGNDPRKPVLLNPGQIEAQSVARSQAWFERLCREAPIEVAVVGEVQLDDVKPLIEKYIGSLPKRSRTTEKLDQLRKLKREGGPLERKVDIETITPQAWALVGFMGCNTTAVTDMRALNIAANILDSRLIKRIREELGIVYSIGAQSRPERCYEDSGFFLSGAPCAPDKPDEVIKEVEAIFQAFAETGPTADELEAAKKQIANHLDTQLKEPSFWFDQLKNLDLHRIKLADLKNIPDAYQALTADQVKDIFKKYDVPKRIFRVAVVPKKPADAAASEKPTEPAPTAP
jgi:zinc protease